MVVGKRVFWFGRTLLRPWKLVPHLQEACAELKLALLYHPETNKISSVFDKRLRFIEISVQTSNWKS